MCLILSFTFICYDLFDLIENVESFNEYESLNTYFSSKSQGRTTEQSV